MLSVLCVTSSFPTTPGDREGNFVYHSLSALAKAGTDVSVLVTQPYVPFVTQRLLGRSSRQIHAEHFPEFSSVETVVHFSIPRNYARPVSNAIYDFRCGRAMRRLLEHKHFDLIHAHGEDAATAASAVSRFAGIPSVVTLHGIDMCPRHTQAPAQQTRFRTSLNAVDRVILVGEPLRNFFGGITKRDEHFRVVPNGFLLPSAEQCAAADVRPWSTETLEMVSVSNLHEGNGIDITLDALAILNKQGFHGWRYRVIGDGDQSAELKAKTRDLGLTGRVQFLGAKSHSEVYKLLATANVFVLPSYREAFGIAYLEAMALGLLAIGVQGQGPEAFIRNGESGLLVPPRDAHALASCLQFAMKQTDQCRTLAEHGRSDVWNHWTWDCHAQHLLDIYAEVLHKGSN